MEEITFVTGNKNKYKEVNEIFDGKIIFAEIDLVEIQSRDIYEVVKHKAKEVYKILKKSVLVEDISLYLECLNKFPGPFIKFMISSIGPEGIYNLVKNYREKVAIVRCVVCYFDGEEFKFFTGDVKGKIVSPKGKNGGGLILYSCLMERREHFLKWVKRKTNSHTEELHGKNLEIF